MGERSSSSSTPSTDKANVTAQTQEELLAAHLVEHKIDDLLVNSSIYSMDKLLEFGRRALFYVRVLSGYEERRIRSYRLQLETRLRQAQEKKEALRRIPEQAVLAEVRRMVEEMQTVNRKLEETAASIDEYFRPLDKEAEIIMKIQLEGEEKTMTEMMKTVQTQALLEEAEVEKISNARHEGSNQRKEDLDSTTTQEHARMR